MDTIQDKMCNIKLNIIIIIACQKSLITKSNAILVKLANTNFTHCHLITHTCTNQTKEAMSVTDKAPVVQKMDSINFGKPIVLSTG